jgi:hypothetical protein
VCIEDVRMGRQSNAQAQTTEIAAGGTAQVLPADPYRYCLILSPPSSGSITYNIRANPADGEGLTFHQGSSPLALDIQSHGDLVRRAWFAYSANAVTVAPLTVSMVKE